MVVTGNDPHVGMYNTPSNNIAPAANGQTWVVSVYVKANVATTGQIFIFGAAADGNVFDAVTGQIAAGGVSIGTDWTRVSYAFTFTKGISFIQVRLDGPDTGGTGQTVLPEIGQILIGNSSNGFTMNRITAGSFIQITNTSGGIQVGYTGTSGSSAIFAAQATSDLGFVYDNNIIATEDLGAVGGNIPLTYDLGVLRLDGIVSLSNLDQSVKSDYLGYSIIFGF